VITVGPASRQYCEDDGQVGLTVGGGEEVRGEEEGVEGMIERVE
jgi:hypothetical protein